MEGDKYDATPMEKVHVMHYDGNDTGDAARMPTLLRFGNLKIQIFADDHNPPHFHLVTPEHEALIRLSDLVMIAGTMDRRSLELALDWARRNGKVLDDEWNRLNER